ncbi:hypothetical protein EMCRGX_G013565 [Ephydatia muelleri]
MTKKARILTRKARILTKKARILTKKARILTRKARILTKKARILPKNKNLAAIIFDLGQDLGQDPQESGQDLRKDTHEFRQDLGKMKFKILSCHKILPKNLAQEFFAGPLCTAYAVLMHTCAEGGSNLPIFTYWVISAGGILGISFVFTLVCSCVFRTRQHRRFDYGTLFVTGKRRMTTQKPGDRSAPFSDQDDFLASTLTFDEWEVPRSEVTVMENEPLGKGYFGEVFKGKVAGFLRASTSSLHSPIANSIDKANFLKEIEMMKTVSQGGSELSMYVINMVMEDDPGRICPAIPYMEPRGVYSCLAPKEDLLAELGPVGDLDLISFARQIAAGMEYLSSLNIVHRDLACRNILIGRNKLLKISDFGMSRVVMEDEVYINTSHGRLPLRWMAVESIFQREFTIASDVWA